MTTSKLLWLTAGIAFAALIGTAAADEGAVHDAGNAGAAAGQGQEQAQLQGTLPLSSQPAVRSTSATASQGPLHAIGRWLTGPTPSTELLPPDEAYKISVRSQAADTIVATLTPADGYYLYRDRIHFRVEEPAGVSVATVLLPRGEMKDDATFGKIEVYHHPIDAVIRLVRPGASVGSIRLHATYQGCNEPLAVCYPPIDKTLTVSFDPGTFGAMSVTAPSTSVAAGAAATEPGVIPPNVSAGDVSEDSRIRELFTQGGSWALFAAFFGFGILLAFTPCMLPMIPILSGVIAGQARDASKRRVVGLSAAYVLGMAIAYAVAGVIAGLAGAMLSAALQSPWVLGSFATVFVLLALSMFGLYELQLPSSLQTSLTSLSRRIPGGQAIGVFLMGVVSAVIVGPCVAAPLAGALLYISQTRDAVLGGVALFSMAVGMGVPLLVVGASTGSLLRRAGRLTQSIKRFFGVTMLGLAIYLVSPVIPIVAQQLLWATLLVVSAMFVHAIDPLPSDAIGAQRLFKGVGVMALIVGVALLIGVLSGSHDLLQPLAGFHGGAIPASSEIRFEPVKSVAALNARIESARGRPVMLDFWAEWCVSCKEMDRFTFSDARVQARLKDVVLLRADLTANNADDQALLRRFSLFGPPGIIFFDTQGKETGYRVIGFESADKFLRSLGRAGVNGAQEVLGQR